MGNKSIANEDKIDRAYHFLCDEILQGRLKPLDSVDQTMVAKRLNCSRLPVRQALLRLALEGLVIYEPHKGATVTPLSIEDMIEIYTARSLLESMLAKVGARKCEYAQLVELKRLLEAQKLAAENYDFVEFLKLDQQFHNVLYLASGFLYICSMVDQLRQRATRYLHVYISSKDHLISSLAEHHAIIEAIEAQAYDHVGELITANIEKYKKELAELIAANNQAKL